MRIRESRRRDPGLTVTALPPGAAGSAEEYSFNYTIYQEIFILPFLSVDTQATLPEGSTAREIKAVIQSTPLKKWGGAAEIAKTVFFLVQTEFITGECIRVDGGRHLY